MEHLVESTKHAGYKASDPTTKPAGPMAASPSLHPMLRLQQQAGNFAVQGLLRAGFIQAKLAVSQPDDPAEREADQIADRIMRSHSGFPAASNCSCAEGGENCEECQQKQHAAVARQSLVSRQPALTLSRSSRLMVSEPGDGCEQEAGRVADQVMRMTAPATLQQKCSACDNEEKLQRKCAKCEDEEKVALHRKEAASGPQFAPPVVQGVLNSPGQALDPAARAFMEPRFGYDFSHIRVHTGPEADESARAVNALAYTVGNNIVFAAGQYATGSRAGQALLAHELAHTVQQGRPSPRNRLLRKCGPEQIGSGPPGCHITDTPAVGQRFFFVTNCDEFAAGQLEELQKFPKKIPKGSVANVLGLASSDGDSDFNKRLSCSRAFIAAAVLSGNGATVGTVQATGGIGAKGDKTLQAADIQVQNAPVPVTVTFPSIRAASTPQEMADRIPPRANTPVAVTVSGSPPPASPITLSVLGSGGNNGTVLINGATTFDLSSSAVVELKGVTQTLPHNHLNLTLLARQGGAIVGQSSGFSVSAIPQNMSSPFKRLVTGDARGIVVDLNLESDSKEKADLDQVENSERIEFTGGTGIFAHSTPNTSCYLSSITPQIDTNAQGPLAALHGTGHLTAKQTFMFKDKRTGATDIPMTNSGFLINWDVKETGIIFKDFHITTARQGAATNAHDPNPLCPSVTIKSAAGTSDVTPQTQDI